MAAVRPGLRLARQLLPVLALCALVLFALVLMSDAAENSARFGQLYSWLLVSSTLGLLILAALILHQLYRLVHQYRVRAPGARLTLRLVTLFVALSMAPVGVVYYFSVRFLQAGIDSWFDVRVDRALEDALELSRAALDMRMREVLKLAGRTAGQLVDLEETMAALTLSELRADSGASEMTLLGTSGRIVAVASSDPTVIVPDRPPEVVLLQVRQGHDYVGLDPIRDVGFHIRAVVTVPRQDASRDVRILQVLFPVSERVSILADSVRSAFDSYKELGYLRAPLKTSFILTLSLVMLLGLLGAFWAAFFAARRLVQPVRDLAEGTRAVAAGRYDKQLTLSSNDELGFLVHSFNLMTRNLAQARDSALHSQQALERQHAYLEAVLSRLSSGVLALDGDGHLRTANAAAGQVLGLDLDGLVGSDVIHSPPADSTLSHLLEAIASNLNEASGDWRQEVTLFGSAGRQVLMCRGSSLADTAGTRGTHVIVFDDITTLVQAERDAAWAEVARRLAHEIKNPLTPIQLAAERIRHKYLKTMAGDEGRVLDRSTHTIVQQVQAMKEMVDEFNQYARAPQLRLVTVPLNDFITEVLYLYRDYPAGIEIRLNLDARGPVIDADVGRLRQLLHNVTKNAIEAIRQGQGSTLEVGTRWLHEGQTEYVELVFQDDGPGFPEDHLGNLFEPYVTTKPKGTGLGLAIVKRIVEEHGGLIRAENPPGGGARIVIRFPIRPPAEGPVVAPAPAIALPGQEEA